MTTSTTTSAGTAIRAVFAQTSQAWADGDGQAFAAWYAPPAARRSGPLTGSAGIAPIVDGI
jgi:hypothetical protein